jgi:hypothetical protein
VPFADLLDDHRPVTKHLPQDFLKFMQKPSRLSRIETTFAQSGNTNTLFGYAALTIHNVPVCNQKFPLVEPWLARISADRVSHLIEAITLIESADEFTQIVGQRLLDNSAVMDTQHFPELA